MIARNLTVLLALLLASPAGAEEPVELTLREVVARARKGNVLVDRALARVLEISARADRARLAWMGSLGWSTDFGAIPVCDVDDSGLKCAEGEIDPNDLFEVAYRPHLRGYLFYGLPIYTFGKILAGMDAGDAGEEAGNADVEAQRTAAVQLAKKAWWGALLSAELLDLTRDGLKRLEDARTRLARQVDEDEDDVDERDLWRLDVARAEVLAYVHAATRSQALARSALRTAAGLQPGRAIRVKGELAPVPAELGDLEATVKRALAANSKLQAAEALVRTREAEVELERARFYPDLVVGVGAYYRWTPFLSDEQCLADVDGGGGVCESGDQVPLPVPAVRLKWSLDIAGRLSALRRAEATVVVATADARALQEKTRLEVESAWHRLAESRALLAAQEDAVRAARKWMVGATMDEEMGVGESGELKNAVATWAKAKAAWLQRIHDLNLVVAELSQLVGEDLEKIPAPETSKQEGGTR